MIVSSLINSATLYRIQEGGLVDPVHNFRLDEYLNEVTTAIFKAPITGVVFVLEILMLDITAGHHSPLQGPDRRPFV